MGEEVGVLTGGIAGVLPEALGQGKRCDVEVSITNIDAAAKTPCGNGNNCHYGRRRKQMASMNISLPDPMRDCVQGRIDHGQYASASNYVRDLIRRDQEGIEDADRWLRDLDGSIADSFAEMNAGGGVELDAACDAVLTKVAGQIRR